MKFLISILILAALIWGGVKINERWTNIRDSNDPDRAAEPQPGNALPGMPAQLEDGYEAAKKRGASSLKKWLATYRRNIQDPRLAAIEMDYVVLVGTGNAEEARRVLAEIDARINPDSPVYERLKSLEKVYQ